MTTFANAVSKMSICAVPTIKNILFLRGLDRCTAGRSRTHRALFFIITLVLKAVNFLDITTTVVHHLGPEEHRHFIPRDLRLPAFMSLYSPTPHDIKRTQKRIACTFVWSNSHGISVDGFVLDRISTTDCAPALAYILRHASALEQSPMGQVPTAL